MGMNMVKKSGHILVVDDDERVRGTLADLLEIEGYTVSTAADGVEALSMLRSHSYDLILLDIMMPGMDGYQVLELLKQDEILRHIPVVVISAVGESNIMVRCIELGAEDYLSKPYQRTILRARVKSSLERKQLRDQEKDYLTQLQSLYQEVQAADQAKSEFVALVAHELRTPLSTLWAYAELLSRAGTLNEKQEKYMREMSFTLERMKSLVSDLDDVSRIETGNLGLNIQSIVIGDLIEAAVASLRPKLLHKQHELVVEVPNDAPLILGDRLRLTQILVNLISNAIKYTPQAGHITVSAQVVTNDERAMLIYVQDTGYGIREEEQKRIFGKFFRSEEDEIRKIGGTGLGLNITRNLVEKQGGRIWFDSTFGKGTTFYFTMPLADE